VPITQAFEKYGVKVGSLWRLEQREGVLQRAVTEARAGRFRLTLSS
jgi:hypothetical protein